MHHGVRASAGKRSLNLRAFSQLAVQNAEVELVVKTRNREHVHEIVAALQQCGFKARAHPVD